MKSYSLTRTYKGPAIVAIIIFAGLLFALFGDGLWDAVSWLLLTIPLLVLGFFFLHNP